MWNMLVNIQLIYFVCDSTDHPDPLDDLNAPNICFNHILTLSNVELYKHKPASIATFLFCFIKGVLLYTLLGKNDAMCYTSQSIQHLNPNQMTAVVVCLLPDQRQSNRIKSHQQHPYEADQLSFKLLINNK